MAKNLAIDAGYLKRMIQFCRMMGQGKGTPLKKLQTRFKMSRRTIFRDFNALEEMGVVIEIGDGGYRTKQKASDCKKLIAAHYTKAFNNLMSSSLK